MTLTGKNVIISLILLGMVVAGLSTFVSDTAKYYDINSTSDYVETYTETTDIIQNMSKLTQKFQKDIEGEGGIIGDIIGGIVAIPGIIWSLFHLLIIDPIRLSTTLLGSVLGIIGTGANNVTWIVTGIVSIIVISIIWVVIRARFRYNV